MKEIRQIDLPINISWRIFSGQSIACYSLEYILHTQFVVISINDILNSLAFFVLYIKAVWTEDSVQDAVQYILIMTAFF